MSFLGMKQRGNLKRVRELHELGQRPDAIVERFNRHGIKISQLTVEYVTSGEADEMDRHSLPRKEVEELEAEIKALESGLEA